MKAAAAKDMTEKYLRPKIMGCCTEKRRRREREG
jgi:hypothetical protein